MSSDKIKSRDIFSKYRDCYDVIILIDTHCKKELEPFWRAEWGYEAKFSSHSTNSRGVSILFKNSFSFQILKEILDDGGNFFILSIKVQDYQFTLVALYGPNSDNRQFFKNLQTSIESLGNTSVIMCGEWNVPLDYDMDTLNYKNKNNEKAHDQIHDMMQELDLLDTFRELHPDIKRYSWRGPGKKQARLDYFLVSSDLQHFITESDIGVAYRSDHSPVFITLDFNDQIRGKGTWKFNNCLLYDKEYIEIVKNCIYEFIKQYKVDDCENLLDASFSIDDQLLWETLKLLIRGKTISYSSFRKKERDKKESDLENKLSTLYANTLGNQGEITKVELELKHLREERFKGIIMRSKAKWNVEGERSTKYFCNLEKRHFTEKTIPKLILDDNSEITDQNSILKEQKNFYQNLYASRNTVIDDVHIDTFFDENNPFISKLTQDESDLLEGKLNLKEVLCSLKDMRNGKSPGMDGFTTEFYKFFGQI